METTHSLVEMLEEEVTEKGMASALLDGSTSELFPSLRTPNNTVTLKSSSFPSKAELLINK